MTRALLLSLTLLAGCGLPVLNRFKPDAAPQTVTGPAIEAPVAVEETALPDSEAAVPAAARAGETVAGLGDPTRGGLWMETPLVAAETQGRVTNPVTGKWARLTLLPSGGAPGSGSRLSAQAMQALGVPLTELVTVEVDPGA